nr:conotoxin precursor O1 [Conus ebraeus]UMA82833.1 conotoxin precursor O1 [Conus ebraeus]DAZ85874.1 TPA_inf: conotoxin precursor O1 [Conus ebraeus]DAZ86212.1 TPA_inf: conotoxin precursor O1 [Conus ebraeus]
MKVTCVLIVAVLILTACQLITAEYSRDKVEYPAERSRITMKGFRPTWTKRCSTSSVPCLQNSNCCSGTCQHINLGHKTCM